MDPATFNRAIGEWLAAFRAHAQAEEQYRLAAERLRAAELQLAGVLALVAPPAPRATTTPAPAPPQPDAAQAVVDEMKAWHAQQTGGGGG